MHYLTAPVVTVNGWLRTDPVVAFIAAGGMWQCTRRRRAPNTHGRRGLKVDFQTLARRVDRLLAVMRGQGGEPVQTAIIQSCR